MSETAETQNQVAVRPYKSLPALDIGWLTLKDHFIATVGPHSGAGVPLKDLLVIADAKITPNASFPKHPHKDMEILTWVVKGTLHHQDNKGMDQLVPEGHLQLMSARDGIFHAEGNATDGELRILQIWIRPNQNHGTPEVCFEPLQQKGFKLMAGPEKAPLKIRQNLWLFAAMISGVEKFTIPSDSFGYAVLIGDISINGSSTQDGDGALLNSGSYSFSGEGQVVLIQQSK
nr:pirin family protein [Bdellovibrio sp. HAGR004]